MTSFRSSALVALIVSGFAMYGCDNSNSVRDAGSDSAGGSAPTVVSTMPLESAVTVALNTTVTATFSEPMAPSTLTATSFTLTSGAGAAPIVGAVMYAGTTAVFVPAARLASNTTFTATITTAATSVLGVPLASDRSWSFTTGDSVAAALPVSLGSAGAFVILANSGISTVPTAIITGDLGISPAAATFITGFGLIADSTNVFSTSPQVTGRVYAADYSPPTPINLTTAVLDMGLAFADAAGRAPDVTELRAGNIGGMTLAAGVYKWGTGLLIPTDLTLTGSATDVFIFQIAQDLTVASATNVTLSGGALARNVFWQVSGRVEIGTTSHFEGVVLSQTSITLGTGASINGRLLAATAVSIDGSTVVQPAQ